MVRLARLFAAALLVVCSAQPLFAQAEAEASGEFALDSEGGGEPVETDSALDHWWIGAGYRYLWVPGYMLDAFLDRAPEIANSGFSLLGTYRTGGGLNIQFGVGYVPFAFNGPLLGPGSPIIDTEIADSDLGFVHLTGSLLWDIEFHKTVALEIGVGLDLGLFTGDVIRNEAYLDGTTGEFRPCAGPNNPPVLDPTTNRQFCEPPMSGGATDDPGDEGEHYNVKETGIPPAFALPMLPHVALRVQPFKYLAVKAEFAFGIATMWAGVSIHASFGAIKRGGPEEVFVKEDEPSAMGRVLGRVVEAGTNVPVADATVTLTARALSPLSTMDDGRFIVDRLDAGELTMEIEHEAYLPGKCSTTIPEEGGDVSVICYLAARARVGAISGQLKTETGKPVGGARVEIEDGNRIQTVIADSKGVFAAVDLPEGTYRLRVDAEGYLLLVAEIEVEALDTATPKLILIKKPKRSLVTLQKQEIVISQQVRFKSNSAEIEHASDALLSEIADVLLRNRHVERVEIQGHTDNTGPRDNNMRLSQARAESVRDWLVEAGVDAERLVAKGYGPDAPIADNKTAAQRAKNRRVQFIIRKQSAEVGDVTEED